MTLPRKVALAAAALLVLALGVSASAGIVAHNEGYLTGDLATGTGLACNAVVDLTGSVYTYTYTLIYTAGVIDPGTGIAGGIHVFDVQNPNGVAFLSASNASGNGTHFTDPTAGAPDWLEWVSGEINVGQTRTFSYTSNYAPMEIEVWTYVIDGGTSADGRTLGMGDAIPEPSSLAAFLFGAAGLIPMVIRRRK
jgi:hypothetical protein